MAPDGGLRRVAEVSLRQIRANLEVLAPQPELVMIDLRANAYGHGLFPVAELAAQAGVKSVFVSPRSDTDALEEFGLRVMTPSSHGSSSATLIGSELFGLAHNAHLPGCLRLVGDVVSVKRVHAGRGVSYGYTYRTREETTLALVALGFADGVLRLASNRAPVLVGQTTGVISGRIAMDQFVVDVSDARVRVGDEAVLFGNPEQGEPTVHDWAQVLDVHPAVITSRLGPRIARCYLS